MKVNEWAANNSENKFYLRPYIVASDASKKETSDVQEDMEICIQGFCGNSGEDDNWCEVLGSSKQFSQSFLHVNQASWQKRLLERYENTMCLLDAIYKTIRYDLALFFVCVRSNVGYIVVAEFITQQEDAEHTHIRSSTTVAVLESHMETRFLYDRLLRSLAVSY